MTLKLGSKGGHGAMEEGVQHDQAAQLAEVSAISTGSILPTSGPQCLTSGEERTQHGHHYGGWSLGRWL